MQDFKHFDPKQAAMDEARGLLEAAARAAMADGSLPEKELPAFVVEVPNDVKNGDLASNFAMAGARVFGMPPRKIAEAVAASTLRAGTRTGGWLPLRWLARLGVDPLRRLHLGEEERQESATTPTLPTRSASDGAAFANAVRREVAARSQGRPERWRRLLVERALSGAAAVPAAAHREVANNLRVSACAPPCGPAASPCRTSGWW